MPVSSKGSQSYAERLSRRDPGHGAVNMPSISRWPEATDLAKRLVGDGGREVRAVVMYGSRLLQTAPDEHSAHDFIVVVAGYRAFYQGLAQAAVLHRPVGLVTLLAGVLPPNAIAYAPDDGRAGLAKCLVVSKADLERALSAEPPDHFLLGRMVQRLGVLWSADEAEEAWLRRQITGAHARVLEWMAPYLEEPVDAERLGRRLLEVCYRGELRPESRGRPDRIFDAQVDHFTQALGPVLERAEAEGLVRKEGGRYALVAAVQPSVARRWRRHFRRSKARSTLRWLKHVMTYANWLPYVVRKVERHTGRTIHLTVLERRLPVIFLWPRVIHVLTTRPTEERPVPAEDEARSGTDSR